MYLSKLPVKGKQCNTIPSFPDQASAKQLTAQPVLQTSSLIRLCFKKGVKTYQMTGDFVHGKIECHLPYITGAKNSR